MKKKSSIKRFMDFMKQDSWSSLLVFFIIAIIFIKFIFFPTLSFLTGTNLPLVIVESCSMYHHENGFEKTFRSRIYEQNNIYIEDTKKWDFQNGLNKGDVIFVIGAKNVEVGDVIIFSGGASHPIIHRLLKDEEPYATKGDNYISNAKQLDTEKEIAQDQVIGKALFKVPYVGWIKLIFFEWARPSSQRGFCD